MHAFDFSLLILILSYKLLKAHIIYGIILQYLFFFFLIWFLELKMVLVRPNNYSLLMAYVLEYGEAM